MCALLRAGIGNDLRRRHDPSTLSARSARKFWRYGHSKEFLRHPERAIYHCSAACMATSTAQAWQGWAALGSKRPTSGAQELAGRTVWARVAACGHMRAWMQHGRGAHAPVHGRGRSGIPRPTLWHASDPPWVAGASAGLGCSVCGDEEVCGKSDLERPANSGSVPIVFGAVRGSRKHRSSNLQGFFHRDLDTSPV